MLRLDETQLWLSATFTCTKKCKHQNPVSLWQHSLLLICFSTSINTSWHRVALAAMLNQLCPWALTVFYVVIVAVVLHFAHFYPWHRLYLLQSKALLFEHLPPASDSHDVSCFLPCKAALMSAQVNHLFPIGSVDKARLDQKHCVHYASHFTLYLAATWGNTYIAEYPRDLESHLFFTSIKTTFGLRMPSSIFVLLSGNYTLPICLSMWMCISSSKSRMQPCTSLCSAHLGKTNSFKVTFQLSSGPWLLYGVNMRWPCAILCTVTFDPESRQQGLIGDVCLPYSALLFSTQSTVTLSDWEMDTHFTHTYNHLLETVYGYAFHTQAQTYTQWPVDGKVLDNAPNDHEGCHNKSADVIVFLPLCNPQNSGWYWEYDVQGFNSLQSTACSASVTTNMWISRWAILALEQWVQKGAELWSWWAVSCWWKSCRMWTDGIGSSCSHHGLLLCLSTCEHEWQVVQPRQPMRCG